LEFKPINRINPGIRKAMTIEQIFFKNQRERRLYELREKPVRAEISLVAGALAEGEAKGFAKGKAEGKAEILSKSVNKSV